MELLNFEKPHEAKMSTNQSTRVKHGMKKWNGKMKWNSEHTRLQLTCVAGAAQCKLNYIV